jgi:hypothetical protein
MDNLTLILSSQKRKKNIEPLLVEGFIENMA